MKYLKIENKKAFFTSDGVNYQAITEIDKEGLAILLDAVISDSSFEMDKPVDGSIANEAEKIIYESIHENMLQLDGEKVEIVNEIENKYDNAKQEYGIVEAEEDE